MHQRFNFSFEQFTTDNGLSHESVINITKDPDGFLWVGTGNGLNRFDGISFKIFRNDPNNEQSILEIILQALHLTRKVFYGSLQIMGCAESIHVH
jgi:ligand-binding sensor domain-containing protein